MARIFMDGFEHGQPALVGTGISNDYKDGMWLCKNDGTLIFAITADQTYAYSGGEYCMRWTFSYGAFPRNVSNICLYKTLSSTYNKLFARFYFRAVSKTDAENFSFFGLNDSANFGNKSMDLKFTTAGAGFGTLYLYINGSSVASYSSAFTSSVYSLVEVLYDQAGNNITIKIDGSTVISYSGTIDSNINTVFLGKSDNVNMTFQGDEIDFSIDDFALNDDSGSVNNSWIGAGVIRLIKPTSDDVNADFTPSTGSDHYALVDDFPDDGDTTYNSSTVSGDIDTFGLESVPSVATGQTINAVQAVYRARSETDVASVAPILISGATTDTGATQSTVLSDYYDTKQKVYDVDPNTSAQWTETNVNAIKVGYKNAT